MLEDVDRIEVISGPGGTTWGTNAVIGVINIVTKPAAGTQGALASGYAGNQEDGVAARYGATLGAAGHWRAYAKHFDRENFERANGTAVRDGGWRNQGGFRADWRAGRDAFRSPTPTKASAKRRPILVVTDAAEASSAAACSTSSPPTACSSKLR